MFFDDIPSTNAYALELIAKSNPNEGTVISTHNQGCGVGQIGRKWYSGSDTNISLSVILKPHFLKIVDMFYLNIACSLAVTDTINELLGKKVCQVKWPNDVYIGDKKIAGILIQQILSNHKISACVVGLGLNVNERNFPEDLPNPTSMILESDRSFDLDTVTNTFLDYFGNYYFELRQNNLTSMRRCYLDCLYRRGELSSFKHVDDQSIFSGEIIGINDLGQLVIRVDRELRNYSFNEIKFLQ